MITIVLADDHPVVRSGIRSALEKDDRIKIIGEAGDGHEAIELVKALQPSILITDMMMPGLTGVEVAKQLREQNIPTKIILITLHSDDAFVLEGLRLGITGYLLKSCTPDELVAAVSEVAAGNRYLAPALSDRAIDLYLQQSTLTMNDPYELLTNREREVLQLSAEGKNNPEIAERLFISPRTVETHRINLMKKLGLQNQTDLIRYALKRGIIE